MRPSTSPTTRLRALAEEVGAGLRRSEVGWGDHGPAPVEWHVAGRTGAPDAPGYRRLLAEVARRGASPEADDRFTVAEWMARDGSGMFDLAVAETAVSVTSATMPVKRMSLHALAVKTAARSGAGDGAELRFTDGAGGFAETLASGLGDRVRLRSAASAVRARSGARRGRGRLSAGSVRAARSSPCRCTRARRIAGLPAVLGGLLRRRRQVAHRAGRRPPGGPRRPSSPTRRSATPTGATRGASGASSARPRPRGSWPPGKRRADAAVAEAVRRCFGVRVARITRVAYPRSYLIFGPGELRGWGAHLADPAGPVHFAGAEASELPSFMEGAVRAGERAAAEVRAAG